MVTLKGSMSTEGEALQVPVLPYSCSICPPLVTCWAHDKSFLHMLNNLGQWPWPACSFRSAQATTLLEFHVPFTNCFICRWFCVVHGLKPPLHCHNWLSFGKFQERERFLITCPCHVSSWLPPSGETCKYATAPSTQKNLEWFSTYWYAPFCCVCLGCCAAEFGSSGGIYELPRISSSYRILTQWQIFRDSMFCPKIHNKMKSVGMWVW
jgi:hypothetical protein